MATAETTDVNLYGKPHDAALTDGVYESPEQYADQGDTRKVKDLLFTYHAATTGTDGTLSLVPVQLPRNTEVTIDQIGLLALKKGESNNSFYTTKELERLNQTGEASEPVTPEIDLSEAGEFELAEWLETQNPDTGRVWTIDEVLERVGTDKDLAHRMLAAENTRSQGDGRKGLQEGLTAIIQATD